MLDRIKVDPTVCAGKPTIRGLRITMDFVLKLLGDGIRLTTSSGSTLTWKMRRLSRGLLMRAGLS